MKFGLKNDGGIECHMSAAERKLIYNALRHYMAYGKDNDYIVDSVPQICELLNVFESEAAK